MFPCAAARAEVRVATFGTDDDTDAVTESGIAGALALAKRRAARRNADTRTCDMFLSAGAAVRTLAARLSESTPLVAAVEALPDVWAATDDALGVWTVPDAVPVFGMAAVLLLPTAAVQLTLRVLEVAIERDLPHRTHGAYRTAVALLDAVGATVPGNPRQTLVHRVLTSAQDGLDGPPPHVVVTVTALLTAALARDYATLVRELPKDDLFAGVAPDALVAALTARSTPVPPLLSDVYRQRGVDTTPLDALQASLCVK